MKSLASYQDNANLAAPLERALWLVKILEWFPCGHAFACRWS
jgi:hypothetical protein